MERDYLKFYSLGNGTILGNENTSYHKFKKYEVKYPLSTKSVNSLYSMRMIFFFFENKMRTFYLIEGTLICEEMRTK